MSFGTKPQKFIQSVDVDSTKAAEKIQAKAIVGQRCYEILNILRSAARTQHHPAPSARYAYLDNIVLFKPTL